MEEVFKAGGNQEDLIKASKRGQPLMIFVSVPGNPTRKETEEISTLWQTSLQNNNIQVQRLSQNFILLLYKSFSIWAPFNPLLHNVYKFVTLLDKNNVILLLKYLLTCDYFVKVMCIKGLD